MFTRYDVIRKAEEIVGRDPGRINPVNNLKEKGCVYTTAKNKEHCIAGQILLELGGNIPGGYSKFNGDDVNRLFTRFNVGIELDDDAIVFLGNVQYRADLGETWGRSLQWELSRNAQKP